MSKPQPAIGMEITKKRSRKASQKAGENSDEALQQTEEKNAGAEQRSEENQIGAPRLRRLVHTTEVKQAWADTIGKQSNSYSLPDDMWFGNFTDKINRLINFVNNNEMLHYITKERNRPFKVFEKQAEKKITRIEAELLAMTSEAEPRLMAKQFDLNELKKTKRDMQDKCLPHAKWELEELLKKLHHSANDARPENERFTRSSKEGNDTPFNRLAQKLIRMITGNDYSLDTFRARSTLRKDIGSTKAFFAELEALKGIPGYAEIAADLERQWEEDKAHWRRSEFAYTRGAEFACCFCFENRRVIRLLKPSKPSGVFRCEDEQECGREIMPGSVLL